MNGETCVNTNKTPFLDKLYMLVLALLPVSFMYAVGPLDLDVVLMAVFFAIFIFSAKTVSIASVGKVAAILILYTLIFAIINMAVGQKYSPKSEIFLRMGRYCLYLFVVFFLGNNHANYEDMMRIYRGVAYAASIYIILQAIFYYGAGVVLPYRIGGASVTENLADVGRLRSFYSEPAELGYNLTPFIACSLFGDNYKKDGKKGNEVDALLVSVGIVLSTSGQGVLCIGMIWALWLAIRIFKEGLKTRDLLLIVGVVIAAIVLYATGILEYTLGRADNTGEGSAINARASGYVSLALLSPLQLLFGSGFGNYVVENTFDLSVFYQFVNYSSLAEFLFTYGIIGTAIWAGFFIYLFRRGTAGAKVTILALLFMSLLGCPMTGKHFPLWLTLICLQVPRELYAPKPIPIDFS